MVWGRKAQVLMSELIIAVFIFTLVLGMVFFLWDMTSSGIMRSEFLHEMDSSSSDALEKLVRTEGYPADWASLPLDNISAIGLASNDSRILDQNKVLRFLDLMDTGKYDDLCGDATISNYDCSRYLLGLKKYELHFTLTDMEDNSLMLAGWNCSTGKASSDPDFLVSVKRSAVLNGEIVKANLVVWV
jgi:hypothetical protein